MPVKTNEPEVFTEGFDTKDYLDVKSLLVELASPESNPATLIFANPAAPDRPHPDTGQGRPPALL
jgi:hypothetical protein